MKIMKKGRISHLHIKIGSHDAKYLAALAKYAPSRFFRHIDKRLTMALKLHIKAVFVMSAAEILLQTGKIGRKEYAQFVKDPDNHLRSYAKAIDKYFRKFRKLLI